MSKTNSMLRASFLFFFIPLFWSCDKDKEVDEDHYFDFYFYSSMDEYQGETLELFVDGEVRGELPYIAGDRYCEDHANELLHLELQSGDTYKVKLKRTADGPECLLTEGEITVKKFEDGTSERKVDDLFLKPMYKGEKPSKEELECPTYRFHEESSNSEC